MYLDHCPSLNLVVEQRPQGRCGVADGSMVRRPDPKLRAARLLFSSSLGPPRQAYFGVGGNAICLIAWQRIPAVE